MIFSTLVKYQITFNKMCFIASTSSIKIKCMINTFQAILQKPQNPGTYNFRHEPYLQTSLPYHLTLSGDLSAKSQT